IRSTSTTRLNSSASVCSKRAKRPAAARCTQVSSRPYSSTATWATASTCSKSATSATTAVASPPFLAPGRDHDLGPLVGEPEGRLATYAAGGPHRHDHLVLYRFQFHASLSSVPMYEPDDLYTRARRSLEERSAGQIVASSKSTLNVTEIDESRVGRGRGPPLRTRVLRRLMHNSSNQQIGQVAQRTTELDIEPLPAGVGCDFGSQTSQQPLQGLGPVA